MVLLSITMMALDHEKHYLDGFRATLSIITGPINYIAEVPFALSHAAANIFISRNALKAENDYLKKQNLLLQARLQKTETLEIENKQLLKLLGSSVTVADDMLIADILSVDTNPYVHSIVINKGLEDGVYVGQPVVDADGIIGQISEVGLLSSKVLLITDISHGIALQIVRNGYRIIAEGTGITDQLKIRHVPFTADIKKGDMLVSSGLGQRYPAGYPVATVTQVIKTAGLTFAQVIAEPTAGLQRSRQVLLVWPNRKTPTAKNKEATDAKTS